MVELFGLGFGVGGVPGVTDVSITRGFVPNTLGSVPSFPTDQQSERLAKNPKNQNKLSIKHKTLHAPMFTTISITLPDP